MFLAGASPGPPQLAGRAPCRWRLSSSPSSPPLQVSGHHTGEPFELPGLPAVPPSGRRVSLETEFMRVKVASERIKEIVVRKAGNGKGWLQRP